jgi:TonB family protein
MLHPFISAASAAPARHGSAPLLGLSASVHVGLLCAGVWLTGVVHPARLTERPVERIQFAELPVTMGRHTTPRRPTVRVLKAHNDTERAFQLPLLLGSFDLELPELPPVPDFQPADVELEIGEKLDLGSDVLHLGVRPSAPSSAVATRHDAYDESAVDRIAAPDPRNQKPRYPWRMRARGLETNFVVYFVVDASGAVDTTTVELPTSVEKDFATAATEVLVRWHFVPAERAGRHVRQVMVQPFIFKLIGQ